MRDCTALSDLFPSLGRRKIVLRFHAGGETFDTGVLLRPVERKLGFGVGSFARAAELAEVALDLLFFGSCA